MEKLIEKKDSPRNSASLFPFAVVVGLMVFFVTSEEPGGLTGVQGFFLGLFAVIFLFVMLGMAEVILKHQRQTLAVAKTYLSVPGNMSITQQESEEGLTIQIHVPKQASLQRATGSVSQQASLMQGKGND